MQANILAVGDVVAPQGLAYLRKKLPMLRKKYEAAFTVVNGENASNVGLTPQQAEDMLDAGADVITLGNHAFRQRSILNYLDDIPYILRPANYAPQNPGRGWGVFDSKLGPIGVVNLIGRVNMDYGPDNPFLQIDKILPQMQEAKLILVDFHAEATSEKLAMGYMLDGRVTAVWAWWASRMWENPRCFPWCPVRIRKLRITILPRCSPTWALCTWAKGRAL